MEIKTYLLPNHAAAALGIHVSQVNDYLPRCGDGYDGDALWICPLFIEVRRSREAIARQMAEHRYNVAPELQHRPRSTDPEQQQRERRRERKQLRAAKRKRLAAATF